MVDELGVPAEAEDLLRLALTHGSWSHESAGDEPDNERLEFLGDAVVGLAVSEYLYRRFPALAEGDLARMRAAVVREGSLAAAARRLELGDALRMGHGAERGGARERSSVLADAYEALMGALYLACGWARAKQAVLASLAPELEDVTSSRAPVDAKTALQELLQARKGAAPLYRLVDVSGPAHRRSFTSEVLFEGEVLGSGSGKSKKASEQAAAAAALRRLGQDPPG